MLHTILIALVRIVEIVFFSGVAGCVVTIILSWYSIFRDELIPQAPVPEANGHRTSQAKR
jgi:hypothetical protein